MEMLYLSYSTTGVQGVMVPGPDIELSHTILFAVLNLFTSSTLMRNKLFQASD